MNKLIHILVADDDQDDHDLFREAINLTGISYSLTTVQNGKEAMNYLLKKDSFENVINVKPDFIVLDLNMPIKDGFATLEEIKEYEELKNIPVYILSTSWMESHVIKGKTLGCAGYFTKPARLEELKASVQKMIGDLG